MFSEGKIKQLVKYLFSLLNTKIYPPNTYSQMQHVKIALKF